MKIECENPKIIVNPNLPDLVGRFKHYFFNGQWFYNRYSFLPQYRFNLKPFKAAIAKGIVNADNYDSHFVTDKVTGETYPIFLCVPCGHCTLCTEKKVNSFVNRIKYESLCYNYKPLFITLTFDDKHLPDRGVSVRDAQLFLKRLRSNLSRGGYVNRIRYVLVSEYGRRTHRTHMHALLFGLPISDDRGLRRFDDILNKSWPFGFTLSRQVDMSNDHTVYYICKYLRKECTMPSESHIKPFCLSSRGHGGIGSKFLKKLATQLRKRVCTEPLIFNKWRNITEPLQWSKYVLDKIYPSIKTSVPLKLRKALKLYCRCWSGLKMSNPELCWLHDELHDVIVCKFQPFVFLPLEGLELTEYPIDRDLSDWGGIQEAEQVIKKFLGFDFSDVHRVDQQRSFLLSNLSLNQPDPDLVQKVARIRRNRSRLADLEKL